MDSANRERALKSYGNEVTSGPNIVSGLDISFSQILSDRERQERWEAEKKTKEEEKSNERVNALGEIADSLVDNARALRDPNIGNLAILFYDLVGIGPETGNTDKVALALAKQNRSLRHLRVALSVMAPVVINQFLSRIHLEVPTERLRVQNQDESRRVCEHILNGLIERSNSESDDGLQHDSVELEALEFLKEIVPERKKRSPAPAYQEVAVSAAELYLGHSIVNTTRVITEYMRDNPQGRLVAEAQKLLPKLIELPQKYAFEALDNVASEYKLSFNPDEDGVNYGNMNCHERLTRYEEFYRKLLSQASEKDSPIVGWYPTFQKTLELVRKALASGPVYLQMTEKDLVQNKEVRIKAAVKEYISFVYGNTKKSRQRAEYAETKRELDHWANEVDEITVNPRSIELITENLTEKLAEKKELLEDQQDAESIGSLLAELARLGVDYYQLTNRMHTPSS